MEKLIKVLKESKVSDWKINKVDTSSYELFYVQDKLETQRSTDVEDIEVTIYIDQDDKRGQSKFTVYPYMDEEDIKKLIEENIFAAKFTFNNYFPLPEKEDTELIKNESNLQDRPFKEIAEDVKEAVFKANIYKEGSLSATEIFLYKIKNRVINSRGVDVSSISYKGNIETIPNWVKGEEEVELYKMINFATLDKEYITNEVKEVLMLAKARSEAINLKDVGEVKVILENEEVSQVFSFFTRDLNYQTKYTRSNLFELGDNMQGDNVTGDKLNVSLMPYYENAIGSKSVDDDGVVLKEIELIKDGIALTRHGSYQFGYYLGEEHPTGNIPVTVVKEGVKPFKEMSKEPYVRCVKFSGMQLDPHTGYLGGEVRLGFYFDGEKEISVTGFSISGNIHELKGKLVYSKDVVTLPRYHGPKYLEIKGMKIL